MSNNKAVRFAPEIEAINSVYLAVKLAHPSKWMRDNGKPWRIRAHNALQGVVNEVAEATGLSFPSNQVSHGPGNGYPYMRPLPSDLADLAARTCGWWRTFIDDVEHFPLIRRMLKKGVSTRGFNSPANWFPFWQICEKFRTPYQAEKFFRRVVRRADQILAPWGLHCSWESLAAAITGSKKTGKAARHAAAATLRSVFREAMRVFGREYFVKKWTVFAACKGLRLTVIDGVKTVINLLSKETVQGCTVYKSVDGFLVLRGKRSYHASVNYRSGVTAEDIVIDAVAAWKRQITHNKPQRAIAAAIKKLTPSDRSLFVKVDDSLTSGNCLPGTQAWLQDHGFGDKKLLPVAALLPYKDDQRVARVLVAAARRLAVS